VDRSAVMPYEGQNFLLCSVWLEICVNSALCFLYSAHQTNGDQFRVVDILLNNQCDAALNSRIYYLNLHHTDTWLAPVIPSTVLMYSWCGVQKAPETCRVISQWIINTTA
jgi:hypothetical protein